LKGADLFDHISENGVLGEKEAAEIISDVLTSLEAMNRVGLAHRDVKPANILMCDKEKDGVSIKLGDFGMATFVGVDGLVRGRCGEYSALQIYFGVVVALWDKECNVANLTTCSTFSGTPGYVAPEILTAGRVGYGNSVDVFSAGVTLYVMLCGYEPFYGETEKELIEANKAAKIDFSENEWNSVSKEARDLVLKMTAYDPGERLTAKDALEHPWIKRLVAGTDASENTNNDAGAISVHSRNIALSTEDAPGEGACVISWRDWLYTHLKMSDLREKLQKMETYSMIFY
jgi:serine/threonine protein kinase